MKILGNLLILASLMALIWLGIKGIAFLSNRAAPKVETLETGLEEGSKVLSDAATNVVDGSKKIGSKVINSGKDALEKGETAVESAIGKKATIDPQVTSKNKVKTPKEEEKDLFREEVIDEKVPYEHDKNTDNNQVSTKNETVVTTKGPAIESAEAKAKIALAEKAIQTKEIQQEVKKENIAAEIPKSYNTATTPFAITNKTIKPYLVIAGAFSSKANAEIEVQRLQKLGCYNAITFQIPGKKYVSAVAGSYSNKAGAQSMVDKLTKIEVDSYIYQKRK